MHTLTGTITKIVAVENSLSEFDIEFTANAVLPDVKPCPDWLKDEKITVRRNVSDIRELGHLGDSIVLTVTEAERFLRPLILNAEVQSGDASDVLVRLLWWKSADAPDIVFTWAARTLTAKMEAKDGEFQAVFRPADLLPANFRRPARVEAAVDKIQSAVSFLSDGDTGAARVTRGGAQRLHAWGRWYAIDLAIDGYAGAIDSIRELARDVDHISRRRENVTPMIENAMIINRLRGAWRPEDTLKPVAMTSSGWRQTSAGMRIVLDGLVDEANNKRTSLTVQLRDDFPMICWDREIVLGKPKEAEKSANEIQRLIDPLVPMGIDVRTAIPYSVGEAADFHVLASHDGTLRSVQFARIADSVDFNSWRTRDGWILSEHAVKMEYMLHLFDPIDPPYLKVWRSSDSFIVEPHWESVVMERGTTRGRSNAFIAGEAAGAAGHGVWVAVRRPLKDGGYSVGIVARLGPNPANTSYELEAAGRRFVGCLEAAHPEGIGTVNYAVVDIPNGDPRELMSVTVAGIPERGAQ